MTYLSEGLFKVTGVTGTTATLVANDGGASSNQPPTQIVITWAVRPTEYFVNALVDVDISTM